MGRPRVRERIATVRAYRQASKSKPTLKLAKTPTLYHVNVLPTAPFLVIPQVSSERREYVPIGWLEPPVIPGDKLRLLPYATLADFALLTSAMHMAWKRAVTGRMKSEYMHSVGVVHNTFPTPPGFRSENPDSSKLEPLALAVLDARAYTRRRRWPISTTQISCQRTCGRPTKPWTGPSTGSIAGVDSGPRASVSCIYSCCTRRCVLRWMQR